MPGQEQMADAIIQLDFFGVDLSYGGCNSTSLNSKSSSSSASMHRHPKTKGGTHHLYPEKRCS